MSVIIAALGADHKPAEPQAKPLCDSKMMPSRAKRVIRWTRSPQNSLFWKHGAFVGWAGGVGGVLHGAPVKSKKSLMSGCAASRAVSACRLKRFPTNARIAVLSV